MKKIIVIVLVILAGGYLVMKNNETSEVKDQDVRDNEEVSNREVKDGDDNDEDEDEGEDESDEIINDPIVQVEEPEAEVVEPANDYQNGTYSSDVSYSLPNGGSHSMTVSVTLNNDVVTDLDLAFDGDNGSASSQSQVRFESAIDPFVISKDIDMITPLSRIGGASLTTGSFNEAMTEIRSKAS